MTDPERDLYSGMIRLHVLHHACAGPIYGREMLDQLSRHGYKMSSGTLYPILHGLEKKGYLSSTEEAHGKTRRKLYTATPLGVEALQAVKARVHQLFREMVVGDDQ